MEYVPVTPSRALVSARGERGTRDFSATEFIGGKLRALYDHAELPCPSRLTEWLQAFADEKAGGLGGTSASIASAKK